MSVCAPDDVINASRKGSVDHQRQPRRVLIHTGVMVARSFDGRVLAGDVIGRAAPRRDSVSGALVRAWRVKFTDPDGDDRTLELSASEIADLVLKGAAPEADQRLAEELEAAEAADASQPAHRRFRGVTRKWYGDAARYNAAFSLLGDRFSLGGYDSPVQAARAWDQVAWRAGRGDDLNVVKFHGPPPQPSHDQQRLLAQRLRDNVRVRNAPVDADAVAASVVPSSPLPKRPLDDGDTPSKKKARPSLAEETPSRLDSKDDIFSSDDESLKPPPADDFLQKSPARLELEDSSDDEPVGDLQPPTPAARHDDAPLVPHPDPVNRVVTESPASSTRESPPDVPPQQPVLFAPDATTPAVSPPPVEAPKPPPQLPDEPIPCLN